MTWTVLLWLLCFQNGVGKCQSFSAKVWIAFTFLRISWIHRTKQIVLLHIVQVNKCTLFSSPTVFTNQPKSHSESITQLSFQIAWLIISQISILTQTPCLETYYLFCLVDLHQVLQLKTEELLWRLVVIQLCFLNPAQYHNVFLDSYCVKMAF